VGVHLLRFGAIRGGDDDEDRSGVLYSELGIALPGMWLPIDAELEVEIFDELINGSESSFNLLLIGSCILLVREGRANCSRTGEVPCTILLVPASRVG
jgi:hypothetical protein